jgi:hypothetical protein
MEICRDDEVTNELVDDGSVRQKLEGNFHRNIFLTIC